MRLDDQTSPATDVSRPADALPGLHERAEAAACCAEVRRQWPALTPNLHRLAFDGGRVQWLLLAKPLEVGLRLLRASVDAFSVEWRENANAADQPIDTVVRDPWRRVARSLARLAAPNALLQAAIRPGPSDLARSLTSAGFEPALSNSLHLGSDFGPSSSDAGAAAADSEPVIPRTVPTPPTRWHYAPRFTPRRPAFDPWRNSARPKAPVAVIGAGLAGCAMAWALAEQGVECQIFETHGSVAQEASGNQAGLFHGIVHPHDGAHARLHRAAALEAQRAVNVATAQHAVQGSANGLLRLEFAQPVADMRALLNDLSLPDNYVRALSPAEASTIAGLRVTSPAWWYPGGGWVQPAELCRSYLERAGAVATLRAGGRVESLSRKDGTWCLLDASGALMAQSPIVVLANAGDAARLLRGALPSVDDPCPLQRVRGQISVADASRWPGLSTLTVPIAGRGYLLRLPNGRLLFGATAQIDDGDPSVRPADHLANLVQLANLTGVDRGNDVAGLEGRTAWRWSTPDRLPLLGLVPDGVAAASRGRVEQVSQVPRLEGLYLCTGFGSRGIAWSALSAQVVAAAIAGAPVPLEADLLDSIDAARFVCSRSRREQMQSDGEGLPEPV